MANGSGKLTRQAVEILRNAERHIRKIDPNDHHRLFDFVRATIGKIAQVDAFYIGFFGDDMTLVVPYTYDQQVYAPPGVITYGRHGLSAWLKQHRKTYTYASDNGRLLNMGQQFGDVTRVSKDAVAVPLIDDSADTPRVFGVASIQSYVANVYDNGAVQAFEWLCTCVTSVIRRDHETDRGLRELTGDKSAGIAPTLPEVVAELSDKLENIRASVAAIRDAVRAGDDVLDRLIDLEQLCVRTQHETFATLMLPSLEVVDLLETLTRREREVAELVANGLDNREIADHLTIAPRTVTTHVTSINRKLGVGNRTELMSKLRPFQ